MSTRVYIAHARQDAGRAAAMEASLRAAGFECERPSPAIHPSAEWDDSLQQQIEEAEAALVLITQASVSSAFLLKQMEEAVGAGKRVLPVAVDALGPGDELAQFVGGSEVVDCVNMDLKAATDRIAEELAYVGPTDICAHQDIIHSIAFAASAGLLVTASRDATAAVWDVLTSERVSTLVGHGRPVKAVALSADGRRALTGGVDTVARVWDTGSGALLHVLEAHRGWVEGVAMTPDGRLGVLGSMDDRLSVWDLETGQMVQDLSGHDAPVVAVALGANGRLAVSASWDNTLRVWDPASAGCLRALEGHTYGVNDVGLSHDGRIAVSGSSDRTVRVWDVYSGRCLHVLEGHEDEVLATAVDAEGTHAISAGLDGQVLAWDLAAGRQISAVMPEGPPRTCVALSPSGALCAVGDRRGVVSVRRCPAGGPEPSKPAQHRSPAEGVAGIGAGGGEKRPHIFVSYSRSDQASVLEMVEALRRRGLNVWIDQDSMVAGIEYRRQLAAAIRTAAAVLYMVTENSAASPNVTKEILWALKEGRPVFPVFLEPTELPDELGFEISGVHRLEFYRGGLVENTERLIRDLGALREATEGLR